MLIKPKNWGDFQHYKNRCPPWIKLHRDLLNNRDFVRLPIASKALAPMLWLLASESKDGVFDGSLDELMFRLHITEKEYKEGIKPLIDKGFFIVASEVLADCLHDATPEREGETEGETETEGKREKKRATRLDPKNSFNDDWLNFCLTERPDLDPHRVFLKFCDYWTAKTGKNATKLDWLATWRNWVREERQQSKQNQSFAERDELAKRKKWEEMTGRKWPEEYPYQIVDVTPTFLEIEQ